jgi:hypothetical protein
MSGSLSLGPCASRGAHAATALVSAGAPLAWRPQAQQRRAAEAATLGRLHRHWQGSWQPPATLSEVRRGLTSSDQARSPSPVVTQARRCYVTHIGSFVRSVGS